MLMRILLWAILIGSLVMGYIGIQSGSATNAAIGIGVLVIGGFALFFLLKLFLHFGFILVKIILFGGLIAIIALSGLKGCQYLMDRGRSVNQQQVEQVQSLENEMVGQSMWEKAATFFSFSKQGLAPSHYVEHPQSNPEEQRVKVSPLPPKISGQVSAVRSGYLFQIGQHFVKLYGIDAPDPAQSCIDKRGERYNCGHKSKMMLERLILGKRLVCQVAGGDYKGNFIATCKLWDVDVGASMLTAGWAVADRNATPVYIPYEDEAHRNKAGLWAGKFIAPWDARHKRRQQEQTIIEQSQKGFWESLFQ